MFFSFLVTETIKFLKIQVLLKICSFFTHLIFWPTWNFIFVYAEKFTFFFKIDSSLLFDFFMHIEKNFKLPWKLEFNGYSIEIMDLIWKIDIVQYWVWKKQMTLMQQPVQTSCLWPAHVFTHSCHQTIIAFPSLL